MRTLRIKKVPSYYTAAQVRTYLEVIGFPAELTPSEQDIQDGLFPTTLTNLTLIQRMHLIRFPWENLDMHYSQSHVMETDVHKVYDMLVAESDKGRGSLCHAQNGLMLGMLRALGYRCYSGAGRVNNNLIHPTEAPKFTPIMHMVIFVQPSPSPTREEEPDESIPLSDTYIADAGFGNPGLARPIPLVDGVILPGSAPPEEHRLIRVRHPESSVEAYPEGEDENDPTFEWRLELRLGTRYPNWFALFQFGEQETFDVDHDAQNFAVTQRPGAGPFWFSVQCVKHFVADEEEEVAKEEEAEVELEGQGQEESEKTEEPIQIPAMQIPPQLLPKSTFNIQKYITAPLGRLVLNGTRVDKRIGDTSRTIVRFTNDVERLQVLKQYFGVSIPESAVSHMVGRLPALPMDA